MTYEKIHHLETQLEYIKEKIENLTYCHDIHQTQLKNYYNNQINQYSEINNRFDLYHIIIGCLISFIGFGIFVITF